MTRYLYIEDALQITERLGFHVRDAGLLASALHRPSTTVGGHEVYDTLELKAAALLDATARFHPMIDGNKRTAWALTRAFMYLNGYELATEGAFNMILAASTGTLTLDKYAHRIGNLKYPIGTAPDER